MSSSEWHLGHIPAHYESTGPGTSSSGMGDHGGVFCGIHPFPRSRMAAHGRISFSHPRTSENSRDGNRRPLSPAHIQ